MPLIDGTYEILRQRALSEVETLVQATDPDGRPVRIVWYDVTPESEPSFERHRRVLRRLGREKDVLLRDVVSRPGAHYSVWDEAGDGAPIDDGWRERLRALGLDPADAELCSDGRGPLLCGLRWNRASPGSVQGSGASTAAASAPSVAARTATATTARGAHGAGRGGARDAWRRAGARSWDRIGTLGPRTRTWLLSALLTLSALGLGLVAWERGDNDAIVPVPEVAGLPAQEAAARLAGLGLTVVPQAQADGEAAGTALATLPAAGTALRPGREVQLLYALPPTGMATQEVPNLVGRAEGAELEARLHEAELSAGPVTRVPTDLPAGTVLAQRPAAGSRLGRGGTVALLVSDGPRPDRTFFPDLVGLAEEDARALARVAGLPAERVLVEPVESSEARPGSVVAMTPAPWHPVRLDDVTLRLLVAGPGSDAANADGGVPDLVGLARDEALEAARAAGLVPTFERTTDPRLPPGVVLQDPAPGASAGGTVRLVVNARPVALPAPTPTLQVLAPRPREVPYRFLIEPGIPEQEVEVRAVTADGTSTLVETGRASGGDVVEGDWRTTTPGPIRFEVYLNDVFYAETRVSP